MNAPGAAALDRWLSATMVRLRSAAPFFGTLALYARFVPDASIATAATDGRDVYYNPGFLASLAPTHRDAIVVHEVLHAALGHVHRRGERDAAVWNQAADIVVNALVADAGLQLPEGALRDRQLERFSVEEVFTLLLRSPGEHPAAPADLLDEPPPGARGAGGAHDDGVGPDGPQGDGEAPARSGKSKGTRSGKRSRDDARHWAAAVERAATVARSRDTGELPGGLTRAFDLADRPKLDWRAVLWRFVTRTPTDFAAFDRRHLHRGLYLETLESVGLTLLVAIDTSGSIDADDLAAFTAELDAMLRAYPATTGLLVYADTEAHGPYPITPGGELPPPVGGGGTDFAPFFALIDQQGVDPSTTVAVYLTDGYGSFPPVEPDVPVLWVVTPGGELDERFPFGLVVRMGA